MIDIRNLRTEVHGEWTKLVADIQTDFQRTDTEESIWVAVKNENADMLTTDSYNMFLLYPLYMAMYYKSDIHLHGMVSEQLYSNVNTYLQPRLVLANGREVFSTDNYEYCKRKGMELPSWLEARTATIPKAIALRLKKK